MSKSERQKRYYARHRETIRLKKAARYQRDRSLVRAREASKVAALSDTYIRQALGVKGPLPRELIDAKRVQLTLHRLTR